MSEQKNVQSVESGDVALAKAKDFWTRNSKPILIVGTVLLLLVGGFWGYKNLVQKPKEEKAADALFKAEDYYRKDSVNAALNGDGQSMGFLKIISKYGGTDAANLAHFYAGSCYIKMDDNTNAIKHLKEFSSDAKQIQQRAYKLLGDASADLGKNDDALDYYKKAAHHFEEDQANSAEALFLAAYLADRVMKNQKEAIALYKELKEKYPRTQQGFDADNYLAQLGVYNVN
ncbi:tetratricopeptide repeat protein [Terrimonas pollutisoli]|uniref:tetratricopeptide repeat protein n=1 Tax=Terrimonas pollutisoli TaxID=3034147 RepID=UPI0023EAD54C|nr:tetratricopeptide repeat protein [Terrimonas sp. H1YJ31]